MRHINASILGLTIFTALSSSPASATDLYVATTGSDSNPGTSAAPFKTILKASQVAKPGDVVNVASGSYTGGFQTNSSGTATAHITYKSHGARITPHPTQAVMWDHRGNYSDIVGFEIDGSGSSTTRNGIYVGGSYNLVQGNHVHNIAQSICDSTGGSAIGSDSYYYGVKNDVTGNIVDHVGSSSCSYVQGIYISTSGNVKNNLVYNVGGAAIHLWHDASNVNIINNTTTSSGVGIVVGGGDFYHSTTGKADYVNVFNNIVFDNGIGITEQGTTGANNSYLNNLVYQNSTKNWDLDPGKSNGNTIAADPQFVNYNRTGTSVDFHLKSTSPAINKGTANLAPSTDIEGTARPQNSYFDIGAYEYKAGAAVMSVSPTSLAFGSQQVGTTSSPPKIITIKNVGTGNMSFPSGFVMSGDYAFGGTGTCTVGTSYAPGASCTASVVFKPTATGTRTGSLKITSNASSVTVPFSGTGF